MCVCINEFYMYVCMYVYNLNQKNWNQKPLKGNPYSLLEVEEIIFSVIYISPYFLLYSKNFSKDPWKRVCVYT